jgi:uncharacterized delta-60 repeat protein
VSLAALGATSGVRAATQPIDGFNPNANAIVTSLLLQPDSKILMGGYFTQLQPFGSNVASHGYIARLNHDGSVDGSFSPNANGVVRVMALQPNGQIIIGGNFSGIQPTGSSAQVSRNFAARLNADGTLDPVFDPNPNGVVYAIVYQPNGQIVIGGSFTTVQPNGAAGPTARNHIARFNADGSLDTTFDPNTDKPVLALALQPNGQIVVGGGFSTFQPNGASTTTTRSCAARINSDGSLDMGFDPEPNGSVAAVLVLPTGQIIMGGEFVTVQPNGASYTTQCDFLARLNSDGTLDSNYIINPLGNVVAVAYQPDGKLLIGGSFTQLYPENNLTSVATPYVARVNADGSVDQTFIPNPNQEVDAIAVQPDGNVVLGGYFTSLSAEDTSNSTARGFIARVNAFGVPDSSLAPDSAGTVFTTVPLANGQMLVGGTFLSIGGVTRDFLARINADGSLDATFAPAINGPVQAIALESNGQYVVGGSFTEVDGIARNNIARLNPDGTLDGVFNPSANGNINAIAVLSTGQILVGGGFTSFAPNGSTTTYGVNYFARLNADGSIDLTFAPNPSGGVFAIAVQSNGDIVVGGGFTSISGYTRGYIARLQPNGEMDPNPFDPEANSSVYGITIQSNGQIIIGGSFTALIPQTAKAGVATTLTNPLYGPQTVLPAPGVSAVTPIYVNHLARLNTDGTLDTTFFPDPSADVLNTAVQSDGSIIVTGAYTSFAPNGATTGVIRNYIGRVASNGTLDTNFNPNANALINTVSVLSNGNILIGGSFTTLQPNGAAAPSFYNHLAILNSDGSINTSFTPGANPSPSGTVSVIAQQLNGQVLVAGSFGPLAGSPSAYLARLNGDATPDTTFNAYVDGPVNSVALLPNGASTLIPTSSAVWLNANGQIRYSYSAASNGEVVCSAQQADGRIILGGLFSNFNGTSGLQNLVRLNTDGTVDTTFSPTPNGVVSAIVIQSDGKIVIGGGFTNVDSTNNAYLARLNTDGTVDTTFAPQPNLQVLALALQPNGQIIVAGDFTLLVPTVATGTTASTYAYNYLARVNSDGTVDSTFNPDMSGPVYTVALLPSGQVLVGGSFTSITPNAGTTVYYVEDLARLNSNGTVDTGFYPDPNAPVASIAVQSNGQIVVAGTFTAFEQNANVGNLTPAPTPAAGPIVGRNYVARINTDGTVDSTFDPNPNGGLTYVAIQANGQIVFGGNFTMLQPHETGNTENREDIARVNTDGTVDPSFDPGFNGIADSILPLADGSLFVGGTFTTIQEGGAVMIGGSFANVGGNPSAHLARLNADSTFDSSFTAQPDGPVNAIVTYYDGSVLVGGAFKNVDGQAQPNIVRLNSDASINTTFSASVNGPVNAMALQSNGQIIIGGSFTSVGGLNSPNLARLAAVGSPDASFVPSVNGVVNAVVIQPNGQIVIGGAFTSVGGLSVGGIARLNSNGSVDTLFNPGANGTVQAIAQQIDGTFYVTGSFTTIGGMPISYAAHIEANGAVDPTFTPNVNGTVNTVLIQPDGKVMLGGSFTQSAGLSRVQLVRFAAPEPMTQAVSVSADQTTYVWTRSGGAPAFSSVLFEETTDGTHWVSVGQGTSADGLTWELTGATPTGVEPFYVRATGVSPSSEFSSSGLVQVLYLADASAIPVISSATAAEATAGQPFLFTVTATLSPQAFAATGLPPGLTINATTGIISGTPTATGTFNVTVSAVGIGGTGIAELTISISPPSGTAFSPAATSSENRLINLSTRTDLAGSQAMIAGFVISGTGNKTVLLRAVGPGLTNFGVSGVMATPEIQLYSSSGSVIAQNAGWGGSSSLAAVFAQVGAFSLVSYSADSAIVANLAPGPYTIEVFDPSGHGGNVLTEIYDASTAPLTAPQRLINISARGPVSSGAGALIGGFVISGSSTKSILVRGIGPGLAQFGVTGVIPDPVLSVFDSNGNLVAQNLVWTSQTVSGPDQAAISPADITNADVSVGAFALSGQNSDTALIANLQPGAYTFQVTSASGIAGEALGEVYELP